MHSKEIKYLVFYFPNGEVYHVPAEIIAEDRTNYISNIDGFDRESQEWKDEFEYSLSNQAELIDWFRNNMNWSDIEKQAIKISSASVITLEDMLNSDDMGYDIILNTK